MDDGLRFRFSSTLDANRLTGLYMQRKRLHLPDILNEDGAKIIADHLIERQDWNQVFNAGDEVYDLDRANRSEMLESERRALDNAVDVGAISRFQYRFETIRVSDDAAVRADSATILDEFAQFLNSESSLAWFKSLTGLENIRFADAQATLYTSGDFLTAHDDAVDGKNRLAAYVFSFTPVWRPEWGGLLMFHGSDGHIDEALTPCWNSLNIFTVPQMHSVSRVVPEVPKGRYSITGWLRDQPE